MGEFWCAACLNQLKTCLNLFKTCLNLSPALTEKSVPLQWIDRPFICEETPAVHHRKQENVLVIANVSPVQAKISCSVNSCVVVFVVKGGTAWEGLAMCGLCREEESREEQ